MAAQDDLDVSRVVAGGSFLDSRAGDGPLLVEYTMLPRQTRSMGIDIVFGQVKLLAPRGTLVFNAHGLWYRTTSAHGCVAIDSYFAPIDTAREYVYTGPPEGVRLHVQLCDLEQVFSGNNEHTIRMTVSSLDVSRLNIEVMENDFVIEKVEVMLVDKHLPFVSGERFMYAGVDMRGGYAYKSLNVSAHALLRALKGHKSEQVDVCLEEHGGMRVESVYGTQRRESHISPSSSCIVEKFNRCGERGLRFSFNKAILTCLLKICSEGDGHTTNFFATSETEPLQVVLAAAMSSHVRIYIGHKRHTMGEDITIESIT